MDAFITAQRSDCFGKVGSRVQYDVVLSVKFGTVDADEYVVVNGSTIIATLGAGAAGSVNVTVVTPGGTSNAVAYTRTV